VTPALAANLASRTLERFATWADLTSVLAAALETRCPVILAAVKENEVGLLATIMIDPANGNLGVDVMRVKGVFPVTESLVDGEYRRGKYEDDDLVGGARTLLREIVGLTGVTSEAWRVAPLVGPWPSWCLALPDALPLASTFLRRGGDPPVYVTGLPPVVGQARLALRSGGSFGDELDLEIGDVPAVRLRETLPGDWSEGPRSRPNSFVRRVRGHQVADAVLELQIPLGILLNGMVAVGHNPVDHPLYLAWSGKRTADRPQP
jgi:hypothetical protein